MKIDYLDNLNNAVGQIISRKTFSETVERLKSDLKHTEEPFVWSVLDLKDMNIPEQIKSGWIFVLKNGVASGCHYHPNSVQHMIMIEGNGTSNIGGIKKEILRFETSGQSPENIWSVIGKGIEHEFFPEQSDMVVVSFHTCLADELEEIRSETGSKRLYEG